MALATAAIFAPAAPAALEPGTPVAVAPGVPGNGRAWELVTSPDPNASVLYLLKGLSVTGDRVSYLTLGPLPGAVTGFPLTPTDFAERGSMGWLDGPSKVPSSRELGLFSNVAPVAFSPDLTSSVWLNTVPGSGESEKDLGIFREGADGEFTLLAEIGTQGSVVDTSTDLERIVFTSGKHLLSADAGRSEGTSIYEIVGSTLHLVDVGNDGLPLSDCGASRVPSPDAVSRDGKRIFFTTWPACAGPLRVYLRTNGATTEISASQCDLPECGGEDEVNFEGATPSGSSAFLATREQLTDEDTNPNTDLYRYDVSSGALTLLSSLATTGYEVAAGPVFPSPDGSRVFFQVATEAAPLTYLADAEGLHQIPADLSSFVQWSADSRYAVFATAATLLPADTDSSVDIYRYDADKGTYALISADGGGAGNGPFDAEIKPGDFSKQQLSTNPYRAMSDDGRRIFFSTAERLLPADRNDAADVYEWADGSLGLVSSGTGKEPQVYLGATPDGVTALFRTDQTLLPADRDGGDFDFYAARIGGGFAEFPAPPVCEGGSCQPRGKGRSGDAGPVHGSAARIRMRRLDRAALRRAVSSGWIALLAEVPSAGRLTARARARIGSRSRVVAAGDVSVDQGGPVWLRLRLSDAARRRLATGGDLRVRLVLGLSHLDRPATLRFRLRGER